MRSPKIVPGQQFGRLTVLKRVEDRGRQSMWACSCACGSTKDIAGPSMLKGSTKSCGCYHREVSAERGRKSRTHGLTKTPTHRVWTGMRARCLSPRCKSYKDYGGRGIGICAEWGDFKTFLSDMGPAPAGLSIERVDNSRGYSKENCIWGTQKEQANNKRDNVVLSWRGETMTASQWAVRLGFTPFQVLLRLSRGWSTDRTLSTPIRKHLRINHDK